MSHELEKVNMVSRFTQSKSGLEFGGLPSGKDSPSKPAGDKVFVPSSYAEKAFPVSLETYV